MSLGFLTESALLPSKAKEIKVGSKSILDLKAVVFQKEQERKARRLRLEEAVENEGSSGKDGDDTVSSSSVYARLTAASGKRKLARQQDKNRGVEKRSRRDLDERELDVNNKDDYKALERKSREMLEHKSKLYEQMMQGKIDFASAAAMKECLVDFGEKRRLVGEVEAVVPSSEDADEQVEIVDEFGRTRRVTRGSVEYLEYAQSHGKSEMLFYEDTKQSFASEKHQESEHGGSFVVSQWEKTLNDTDKMHLRQVHETTEQAKQLSAPSDKQRRKQLRLERIKQQQQQTSTTNPGTVTTASAVIVDAAADVKATEFLSKLM